jgi:hypothetical protein
MDRTHVRWFTAASLTEQLHTGGWAVERRAGAFGPRRGWLNWLTRPYYEDVFAHQLYLMARPIAVPSR